ncbi:MAG TPA: phosphatase domain-containing protein [Candidatus Saccharimonadia bacterium]|nr:phosphatase domain-containing protein [Candidatus Saccharimonadia bacterium]
MSDARERSIAWWHRATLALIARAERTGYAQRRRRAPPKHIAAYRAFANAGGVTLSGRVLAHAPLGSPLADDPWWTNLHGTFRRFATHELPEVELHCRFGGVMVTARTDDEGYYRARIELPDGVTGPLWQEAEVALADGSLSTRQPVMVVPRDAEIGIVSDIDDTVLESSITRWQTALKLSLVRNARTRKPLEGAAELYAALQRGRRETATHPIFYVSSSPWNLYDLLDEFMTLNGLPHGPIFLRDLGFDADKFLKSRGHGHKLDAIRGLFGEFPKLSWVLIGDSGQHDPMLYASAAREFPGRVRAIYIRDVDPELASRYDTRADEHLGAVAPLGVPVLRVRDSREIAAHAASIGLLPEAAKAPVAAEVARDALRPTLAEAGVVANRTTAEVDRA